MDELIYKPEDQTAHPNFEFEEDFKTIEMLVERGDNKEDLEKMYSLKDKILNKKLDHTDLLLFNQIKDRYMKTPVKQG